MLCKIDCFLRIRDFNRSSALDYPNMQILHKKVDSIDFYMIVVAKIKRIKFISLFLFVLFFYFFVGILFVVLFVLI